LRAKLSWMPKLALRVVRSPRGAAKQLSEWRVIVTGKLSAILAAAVVLASAGVASAQNAPRTRVQWQAPYANSYNSANLRYGHANDRQSAPWPGRCSTGSCRTDF
jgi:hypothetical protein